MRKKQTGQSAMGSRSWRGKDEPASSWSRLCSAAPPMHLSAAAIPGGWSKSIGRRASLAALSALVLAATPSRAMALHETVQQADGLAIYFTVIPAAFARSHPPDHTGRDMPSTAPKDQYSHHLIVALFDLDHRHADHGCERGGGRPGRAPILGDPDRARADGDRRRTGLRRLRQSAPARPLSLRDRSGSTRRWRRGASSLLASTSSAAAVKTSQPTFHNCPGRKVDHAGPRLRWLAQKDRLYRALDALLETKAELATQVAPRPQQAPCRQCPDHAAGRCDRRYGIRDRSARSGEAGVGPLDGGARGSIRHWVFSARRAHLDRCHRPGSQCS